MDTRAQTNELRQETAAQKRALDASLIALKAAKAELTKLEKRTAATLAEQKRDYERLARQQGRRRGDHPRGCRQAEAAGQEDQRADRRGRSRAATSRASSTARCAGRWTASRSAATTAAARSSTTPRATAARTITTASTWSARRNSKVRAAAAGTVVYVGWNWADGPDPAWIVVIAHSGNVRSWYAHMQPTRPVTVGEHGLEGRDHRHPGQHRARHRRAPPLDGRAQRRLREPEAVPLGHRDRSFTDLQPPVELRARHRVLASTT